jgi:Fe-S-cluster containining protein
MTLQTGPINSSALFPFSCRGCGHVCCQHLAQPLYVSPPEYIRIQWHFERHPEIREQFQNVTFFEDAPDYFDGVPAIRVREVIPGVCPFILPTGSEEDTNQPVLCSIHPVRPSDCRLFPLNMTNALTEDNSNIETLFEIANICPGFETPDENDPLLSVYTPIRTNQTVQNWFDNQLPFDFFEEILISYLSVLTTYRALGWHLPTPAAPQGKLNEVTYPNLLEVFYSVPPCPQDPEHEHSIILDRLKYLVENLQPIIEKVLSSEN